MAGRCHAADPLSLSFNSRTNINDVLIIGEQDTFLAVEEEPFRSMAREALDQLREAVPEYFE